MKMFDVYPLYEVLPEKAKDVFVYDRDGHEYLDLYGGHAVISIGHTHPHYVSRLYSQLKQMGFYSNAIRNPLQDRLSELLGKVSLFDSYKLFLCNSGAEANENALKLASFQTQKKRIIAFKKAFHGRTSAAVAATDNPNIVSPLNAQQQVSFLAFEDTEGLERELSMGDVCAVIFETIQGVGGLNESKTEIYENIASLCKKYKTLIIADEIQSGYCRTGDFFAFQKHNITPDIITIAKGMGNGFPIGGLLIHPSIKARYGMLGTTFGGNHLACSAAISVLEVIEKESLQTHVRQVSDYISKIILPKKVKKLKGRGLMLGLEFDFEVAELRKKLLYEKRIFTGASSDKNLIRILPPLTIKENHIDHFIKSLAELLD